MFCSHSLSYRLHKRPPGRSLRLAYHPDLPTCPERASLAGQFLIPPVLHHQVASRRHAGWRSHVSHIAEVVQFDFRFGRTFRAFGGSATMLTLLNTEY